MILLFAMIRETYPNFAKDRVDPAEISTMANVWLAIFGGMDFDTAKDALVKFMRADDKGFAPVPGQIISLAKSTKPAQAQEFPTAEHAWQLVSKSIRQYGFYRVGKGYKSLPAIAQYVLGGTEYYIQLCQMDMRDYEFAGNRFRKRYEEVLASGYELQEVRKLKPTEQNSLYALGATRSADLVAMWREAWMKEAPTQEDLEAKYMLSGNTELRQLCLEFGYVPAERKASKAEDESDGD